MPVRSKVREGEGEEAGGEAGEGEGEGEGEENGRRRRGEARASDFHRYVLVRQRSDTQTEI